VWIIWNVEKMKLDLQQLNVSLMLLLPIVAKSKNDVSVRLTNERWTHIITSHTDMKNNKDLVLKTVKEPDMILKGVNEELRAVRFFLKTHLGPKYVMTAYKELNDGEGFIITAYKTSKIDKIVKRGVIWKK